MTKEEIYDEKISPLMTQIIAICKKHHIAHICTFSLIHDDDDSMCCSTANIGDEFNPPDTYKEIMAILYPKTPSPMMLTVKDSDGKVKSMTAIM